MLTIKNLVPEKRIFIVPNGIPDIKVKAKKKGNSVPLILFLSNLIMEKGVFVLLNAFSILRKKGYLFKGVFAGSWSYNIDKDIFFKKIKKLNLEKHIQIKGTIYGEKKISLLNGSDIFVFPTFMKHETFGNVLLEAMRSSLPVVASDEGSIPFIIKNGTTGYITKKEDPHDLADKLAHLLKDENLRNKMGKRGRERYLTHFTFDHFEKNYDHVLHKILYYREKK